MVMKQLLVRFRERIRAFRVAHAGNVTVVFALATIPIIGAVGAAVDYSHVNSARTAMQSAVDATALMLSKQITTLTTAEINSKATTYFTALYTRPEVTNISVTPTYTNNTNTQLIVQASGTVKASFVSLIGVSSINIGASSTVKWGNSRLRVALVLDNTGSMADYNKIGALKTATNNLLTQLKTAAVTDGDVYVSIIPFVKDVNLGASNYNQPWVDWTDWDETSGSCSKSSYTTQTTCTAQGTCSISSNTTQSTCSTAGTCSLSGNTTQSTCTSAGVCSVSGNNTQSNCNNAGTCSNAAETTQSNCTGIKACSKSQYTTKSACQNNNNSGTWATGTWTKATWTTGTWTAATWTPATWTPTSHTTWNGCVVDRGLSSGPSLGNYDTNVVAPGTDPATKLGAQQYSPCPQPIMALNYNWNSMTTLVNNMAPGGSTNQAIGLQLGWMSLAGGGPFTVPAMDSRYKYQQVIILLTDGLNTQDRWYGDGSNPSSQVDARQKMTCDNLRVAGITLYTVQVNTGGDPTSTLLQQCASDSSKFFLLTSASEMITTFSTIGTQLSNLRVAK
jgi:Flp pilus assembly protein TadG